MNHNEILSGIEFSALSAVSPSFILADANNNRATVRTTGSNNSLNVSIVDASGNQIATFGGASITDRGTFTFGTTALTQVGGVFDDTPPTDLTTGMAGAFRVTPKRGLHINLRSQAGIEIGTSSNALIVDGLSTTILAKDATLTGGALRSKITDGTNNAALANSALVGSEYGLVTRTMLHPGTNSTASGVLGGANAAVTLAVSGAGSIVIEVDAGLVSGVVSFEATVDGTNWFVWNGARFSDFSIITSIGSASLPTRYLAPAAAITQIRVRVSNYSSGSSNARIFASPVAGTSYLANVSTATMPGGFADASVSTSGTGLPVLANLMGFNGATSDRIRVDASKNLKVNLNTAAGVEIGTTASPIISRIGDGTNNTTLRSLTSSKSLDVSIVDGSGNQITSFGGGTQYTDNTTAFAAGSAVLTGAGFLFDDTPPTALSTASRAAAGRVTANRAQHVNFRNASGTEIGTSSNPVTVSMGTTAVNGFIGISTPNALANSPSGYANIAPYGSLRISDEPSTLFYDPFDGAVDTANKWNAATTANGGTFSQTAGTQIFTSGTANSGQAVITSQPSFVQSVPGFLQVSWAMKFEAGTANINCHRFFGVGTPGGAFSATNPLTDAIGWEIDTAGKLQACVYTNGTRAFNADLSSSGTSKQPTDGGFHRYIAIQRTDRIFWYLDTLDNMVATTAWNTPQVQTLPLRVHVVNTTSGTTSSLLTCTGIAVADTARNAQQIADGTYQWRKAKVNSSGGLQSTIADTSGNLVTVRSLASAKALNVSIVDSSGNQITSFGGSSFADKATFTAGTTSISPIGGLFDDTPPTALTTGTAAAFRLTSNRAIHAHLRDNAGNPLATTNVSGSYAMNVNVVQSVGNPIPIAQDNSAFTAGTTYVSPIGAVYNDAMAAAVSGDAAALRMNKNRAVYTDLVSDNGAKAIVDPQGHLMVRERSSVIFEDPMATTVLDTTNKWTSAVGGTTPGTITQAIGNIVFSTPTTTSSAVGSFAQVYSIPTFTPVGTQETLLDEGVFFPTQAATQATAFFGYGNPQATPTVAVPVLNGIGFIYNSATGGTLTAVIWANGVAVYTSSALTLPTLGQYNRVRIAWTAQQVYWYINDMDTPVASLPTAQIFLPSSTTFTRNDLSVLHVAVAPVTTAATTFKFTNLLVGDVGRNNFQLSDANYPWRQAQINASGGLAIGSNYSAKAIVNPEGKLNVLQPPSVLFSDPLNGAAIDTTARWFTSVSTGTAAQTNGVITLSTVITTANQYAVLYSQPVFSPEGMEDLLMGWGASLPAPGANKSTIFMGFGTKPATPSPTIPATDGIGFLYDPTANAGAGSLAAVYYVNNVKTTVATLIIPTAGWHRYRITWDSQSIYWYIDDTDTPVASSVVFAFSSAATLTNTLPVNFTIAGVTSATAVATSLVIAGPIIGNTAKNSYVLQDATYRWRRATVSSQGALRVQNNQDIGRNPTNYYMAVGVLTTAADVLMSLTGYKSGATVAATTTPAVVTTGKTYRIVSITITYTATATAGSVRVSLRANTSGVVAVGSPVVESWIVGAGTPATAGSSQTVSIPIPDGMEFAAGTGIGITIVGISATQALATTGYGNASIRGYEYTTPT